MLLVCGSGGTHLSVDVETTELARPSWPGPHHQTFPFAMEDVAASMLSPADIYEELSYEGFFVWC